MKFVLGFIAIVSCASVFASPIISINDSRVPSAQYADDALNALQEAYEMYPSDLEKRIESFVELFQVKHSIPDGWNVAVGCSLLYRSMKNYDFVSLNVADKNSTIVVEIYE